MITATCPFCHQPMSDAEVKRSIKLSVGMCDQCWSGQGTEVGDFNPDLITDQTITGDQS